MLEMTAETPPTLRHWMIQVWMEGDGGWSDYWGVSGTSKAQARGRVGRALTGRYLELYNAGRLRWRLEREL